MITCPMCHRQLEEISDSHLWELHRISVADFARAFPGTPVRVRTRGRQRSVSVFVSKTGLSPLPLVDLHRGQTIVLMGNADSLNDIDLDLLKKGPAITIGCNRILRLYQPSYFVVADREPYVQELERIKKFRGTCLLSETLFDPSVLCRNIPVQPEPDLAWISWRVTTGGMLGSVRDQELAIKGEINVVQTDPREPLFSGANISFPLVQWAIIMGASRVGLVGIDFSKAYFFGDGRREGCLPFPPKAVAFHSAAASWQRCNRPGIVIRNLSPRPGPLDQIYGKADFKAFLEAKPS